MAYVYKTFVFVIITILTIAVGVADYTQTIPEQIHLAYGNSPDEIFVSWSTGAPSSSIVHYGVQEHKLNLSAEGFSLNFTLGNPQGKQWIHRVKLQNLQLGTKYWYQPQSNKSHGNEYSFTTMYEGNNWIPKLLVYGDMGRYGGAEALNSLIGQVERNWPTAAIHVGDFAYDLDSLGGLNGDDFMNRIQPIAANIPYMTCIGNHEHRFNSSQYIQRYWMPGNSYSMYFSWDIATVHFIAYSTEVYFVNGSWNGMDFTIQSQYEWLEQDLKKANANRDKQPWIIAYGHRPFYCSNSDHDDCTLKRGIVRAGLEDLFFKYGVDVIIEAHEHSYERLWPTYNEKVYDYSYINPHAPVHIISGAAGCNESDGLCTNPIPGPRGPWSAFHASGNTTYGYGRLEVHNATHLYWEELQAVEDDKILDSMWLVQNNHGSFLV